MLLFLCHNDVLFESHQYMTKKKQSMALQFFNTFRPQHYFLTGDGYQVSWATFIGFNKAITGLQGRIGQSRMSKSIRAAVHPVHLFFYAM